jgi:WD40 repeat protein
MGGCGDVREQAKTPQEAMAAFPRANIVKRIVFREVWRLEETERKWCESAGSYCPKGDLITPKGDLFLTSSPSPEVLARSMASGKPVRSFPWDAQRIGCLRFSPDGQKVVLFRKSDAGTRQGDLLLCDAQSGKEVLKFTTPDTHAPESIAFSPDGRHLVSGGFQGESLLFDVTKAQPLFAFHAQRDYVQEVGFSPDGKLVASAGDPAIAVWDVASGKEVARLPLADYGRSPYPVEVGVLGDHWACALSCRGSGTKPDSLSFIDLSTGTLLLNIRQPPCQISLFGPPTHDKYITCQFRLTNQNVKGICLLDLRGRLVAWDTDPQSTECYGISPDGRYALTIDTRPARYAIPIYPLSLAGTSGLRELVWPVRCWEMSLVNWKDQETTTRPSLPTDNRR